MGRGRRLAVGLLAPGLLLLTASAGPSVIAEGPALAPLPSPTAAPSPTRTPPAARAPARPKIPVVTADPSGQPAERRTRPNRLRVPAAGIDLPVIPVGVAEDGLMALPGTVAQVGWYEFGARPADRAGSTVLAGHVDTTREGLGPLARLRTVEPGTEVTVSAEQGGLRRYRVTSVRKIDKARVRLPEIFARDGAERLVLITCGGPFDRRTGYRDNIVLEAKPS
ncbi:MAG TPA: class F sortase [Propionibacteriaceae bacterium]|nr:class F sortase [Propionibacteriaceae bacterium]